MSFERKSELSNLRGSWTDSVLHSTLHHLEGLFISDCYCCWYVGALLLLLCWCVDVVFSCCVDLLLLCWFIVVVAIVVVAPADALIIVDNVAYVVVAVVNISAVET